MARRCVLAARLIGHRSSVIGHRTPSRASDTEQEHWKMRRAALSFVIAVTAAAIGSAQAPATPPAGQAPAGQGRAGGGGRGVQVVSPEVHPDKTVTVRFRAPNAKTVELIGEIEGKPAYPMTKDDATGVWSVTIGPL